MGYPSLSSKLRARYRRIACPIALFGWARYIAPKAKVTHSNLCDLAAAEHRKPPSGGHQTDPYLAAATLGFKDHRHACTELLNSDPASIHRASDLSSRVAQWSLDAAGVGRSDCGACRERNWGDLLRNQLHR